MKIGGGVEFSINYTTNAGAAWGIFNSYPHGLIALRIVLIAILTIYLLYFNIDTLFRIPMTMIIAGAMGNILDFFLYGHVIDMFHVVLWGYDFPVFNVADSAITLGVFAIFCLSWRNRIVNNA